MKVTVLGCGASTGVPAIGPDWGRCDPADPRNRRRRVSVLVEIRDVIILIDTSPDLREQLIDARVSRLDAVIVTHAHADHLHGIDDLRSVNRLMSRTTMSQEFEAAAETFGLSLDDFERITINAMKSSFLPYKERIHFIYSAIKPGYARIGNRSGQKLSDM